MTRTQIALGVVLVGAGCAPSTRARSFLDAQAAAAAYFHQRYPECTRLYRAASEMARGRERADYEFSAGSCELRQGHRAQAIAWFQKAMRTHPSYCDDAFTDDEIQRELGGDPSWQAVLASFRGAYDAFLLTIDAELRQMYLDDQRDRAAGNDNIDWPVVNVRDAARRERVGQLGAAGRLRSADDDYYAAMIFQHGEDQASYASAWRHATHALTLDASFAKARWLAAASKDRYHMSRGEPQLYGTQYKRIEGSWYLWPVDPHVTDADRAEWGVEPLEIARQRLEKMRAKSHEK